MAELKQYGEKSRTLAKEYISEVEMPVLQAAEFMEAHYRENITAVIVAGEVYLNPSYFSTLFKKVMGISFTGYLNELRVEESKRLLKSHKHAIQDIANDIGYKSQSYYSKVFKKYTGLTPNEYRWSVA